MIRVLAAQGQVTRKSRSACNVECLSPVDAMRQLAYPRWYVATALLLLLSACSAALVPVPPPYSAAVPPRTVLRLYRGQSATDLHAVRWAADSVSGIPYFQPLTCDTCRIILARTAIDSVKQVKGREGLGMLAAALPFAVLAGIAAVMSGQGD